jgi:malate dehydrogenase (oxaloacetate-decarboxylating)(NADP+)
MVESMSADPIIFALANPDPEITPEEARAIRADARCLMRWSAYGRKLSFGRDYLIPTPFDPRLIHTVPIAVMKAAVETGVARRSIPDLGEYERGLRRRMKRTD